MERDYPEGTYVKVRGGFWSQWTDKVADTIIGYQWQALNDSVPGAPASHSVENFHIATGLAAGEFRGKVFQDSDVAKWLEAASYSLLNKPDPELESLIDETVDLVARTQQPDGYLNTFFTIKDPSGRWKNVRDHHEMYCAGHMIEAGVAHYQATGKRKLLDLACRLADHIGQLFGPEPNKCRGYPGHPEIELALVRLYRATSERRYLELSKFFVDERGREPHYFKQEARERGDEAPRWPGWTLSYCQAHLPVRQEKEAVGHAVRAMYLYSAMADLALETGDDALFSTCSHLWENVTERRMYVTGGIGSDVNGEAFTFDYDLPNDRAYAETCASIGLVFWAQRMLRLSADRKYGDVMERALYNGVLSGISLDGKRYLYTNPLEIWPEACQHRHDLRHIATERQLWFDCACCPPNVARLLASIGRYVCSQDEEAAFVHLFASGETTVRFAGGDAKLVQETQYPWGERVTIRVHPERDTEFGLAVRIPAWCRDPRLQLNGKELELTGMMDKGYAKLSRLWRDGDTVALCLPMAVQRVRAQPDLRAAAGRVAIQRGPIVYCLEEVDNGPNLAQLVLPKDAPLRVDGEAAELAGAPLVRGRAIRVRRPDPEGDSGLYCPGECQRREQPIIAVPYHAWGNREPGEMVVWLREE